MDKTKRKKKAHDLRALIIFNYGVWFSLDVSVILRYWKKEVD